MKNLLSVAIVLILTACGGSESEAISIPSDAKTPDLVVLDSNPATDSLDKVAESELSIAWPDQRSPGKFVLTPAEQGLPDEFVSLREPWMGDFDGMVERRVVRVLTVYQKGGYFLDGAKEKGITNDLARLFETFLNERLNSGHVKLHVVLIPVEFDQLLNGLVQGYGDIAAAGITITESRDKIVDFGKPMSHEVREVVITGPATPELASLEDLSGKTIYVKPGSSYVESLEELNRNFRDKGLQEVNVLNTPRLLDDVDLLEMVSAGLLPMIVMDDYKARFWAEILEGLQVREDLVIQGGRYLAWAFRENSPLLKTEVDEFARTHRQGSLMGNILIKRYLKNTQWVTNALDPGELERYEDTIDLFKRYSAEYGFNHLMIVALSYQESGLDQNARSSSGAIGVMQLLKSTAADPKVGIPDIEHIESNIHAGVKYLDFLRNRYFDDPELDALNRALFSFAAYNAGPARVRGLRKKAEEAGLDRNKWFNNVELIAAREIGRETVQYVSNIYKYYLAYTLISDREAQGHGKVE